MRIIILGSSGLLGSSLVPHLKQCGHSVVGCAQSKVADMQLDLTSYSQVHNVLDNIKPEVIINLVALTNVDECEKNPQLAYLLNVRTVENIARWINESSVSTHLIHISTDQVYDGIGPHKESDIVLTNYYAFSKFTAEKTALMIPSTILRTNFFGPSLCPGRISLSDWLIKSLKEEQKITVFDDIYFSPLSIKSLVKMISAAVIKKASGLYNLGSKDGFSKADFAFELASAFDLPTRFLCRDTSKIKKFVAYRPKDMRMDSSLFERDFSVNLPSLSKEIQSLAEEI